MEYRYDFDSDQKSKRGSKGHAGIVVALLCIILAVLCVLAVLIVLKTRDRGAEPVAELPDVTAIPAEEPATTDAAQQPAEATPQPQATSEPVQAGDGSILTNNPIPAIVKKVSPGVVGVLNYVEYPEGSGKLEVYGSGTGFIVSEDGYILTNAHVIEDAVEVHILFEDGTEETVTVVGADVKTDVAVLQTSHVGLEPVELGDSDTLQVGEFVLAIGNPLDSIELYGTVTLGIISAISREINIDGFVNNYIQTDAAINFGNSGGPLIDMHGKVIGINSAKSVTAGYDEAGNSVAAEGIGFALPINDVIKIMDTLVSKGNIERPGIGVTVTTLTAENAQTAGTIPGVAIYSVTEGGPAAKAGLQVGDVFVSADGIEIAEQAQLVSYLSSRAVGDTVVFVIYRNGRNITINVTVGDMNKMS